MPLNPYTARLEAELDAVKRKRVGLRKLLERGYFSGDALDQRRAAETVASELNWCQREYERLHHELGRPLPLQHAIKLDPVRPQPATMHRGAVKLGTVTRSTPMQDALKRRGFDGRGYITKVMRPER